MSNIVDQAKVAVLLDGRDAETVLTELKDKTEQYTEALIKAFQAGNQLDMKNAIKGLKDTEKEMDTIKKQTFDVTKVMQNLNGTSLNDLKKAEKEITAELSKMTRGTEEFANKSKDLQKVTAEIGKVKTEMKGFTDSSEHSAFSMHRVWEIFTGMGIRDLARGTFDLLKEGFTKVVESTKGSADQFKFAMDAMSTGVNQFFKSIATGDWSNFFKNIFEAIKVGHEYSQMLDEIQESNQALKVKISEMNLLNAQDTRIYRDATKSRAERVAAIDKIVEREKSLSELKEQIRKKDMDNELMSAEQQTHLSKKRIVEYVENFNAQEDLRKQAEELRDQMIMLNKLREPKATGGRSQTVAEIQKESEAIQELEKSIKNADSKVVLYYGTMTKMQNLNDKGIGSFDALTQKISAHTDAYTEFYDSTQRAAAKRAALMAGLETEGTKLDKKEEDALKNKLDSELKTIEAKYGMEEVLLKERFTNNEITEKAYNELSLKLNTGLLNAKIKTLEDYKLQYQKYGKDASEIDRQIADTSNKIEDNKIKQRKTDFDELLKSTQQNGKDIINARKILYEKDLADAGNNAALKKAIEEKYREDILTLELGNLIAQEQFLIAHGEKVADIEQQIEDKKAQIIEYGYQLQDKLEKDRDAIRKQYNLESLAEQEAKELADLEAKHSLFIGKEEDYQAALLAIKMKYIIEWIGKYQKVVQAVSDFSKGIEDIEVINTQTKYQKQFNALEDSHNKGIISDDVYNKKKTALEKKQADEEKNIKKKYADINFAIQVAEIIGSTALAIAKAVALSPVTFGLPWSAFAAVNGGVQIAKAAAERNQVKQLATGQYNVIGASDGRSYNNIPYSGQARTGFYKSPTLISEMGGEVVIDHETVKRLVQYEPFVIDRIMANRVNQQAAGNYPTSSPSSSVQGNDQLTMLIASNISVMEELKTQIKNGIEAKMSNERFDIDRAKWEKQKQDVTRS